MLQNPSMFNFNWIIFPKYWQCISNINLYFKKYIPQPCVQKVHRNPPNWHLFILIVCKIYPIQTYILWYSYLYWGVHVSCICTLVLDICCQRLGNICKLECQLNIYVGIGYIMSSIGGWVEEFFCALLEQGWGMYIFKIIYL